MTLNQLESHLEQMEAHRVKFNKLWKTVLIHHPVASKLSPEDRMKIKDCCWVSYVQALGREDERANH